MLFSVDQNTFYFAQNRELLYTWMNVEKNRLCSCYIQSKLRMIKIQKHRSLGLLPKIMGKTKHTLLQNGQSNTSSIAVARERLIMKVTSLDSSVSEIQLWSKFFSLCRLSIFGERRWSWDRMNKTDQHSADGPMGLIVASQNKKNKTKQKNRR